MKSEDISGALEFIDDEILNSANEVRKNKKHKFSWIKFAAAAAVICVIAFALPNMDGLVVPKKPEEIPPVEGTPNIGESDFSDLPQLVYESSSGFAMGFEGYLAYDIDELKNGNPWNEGTVFETLPVYKNTAFHETGLPAGGLAEEEMLERINKITGGEHGDIKYSYVSDFTEGSGIPADQIYSIEAVFGSSSVKIEPDGNITVKFDYGESEGISLPEEYDFTHSNASEESAFFAIEYIYSLYAELMGIENPAFVYSKDYTFSGETNASYSIYDFSGDELNDILSFSFNRVQLAPNDEGKLMLIRIYDGLAAAEKLGDYPIITASEAKEILINGGYITSAPYEIPGEEYISRVELIYRSGNTENIFMPYYRFLVEVPELEQENGLKNFCAYYVPAVEMQYLEGYPIWNGSFN